MHKQSMVGKKYRVRCDLVFADARVALALSGIIRSFEASVVKCEGPGKGAKVKVK